MPGLSLHPALLDALFAEAVACWPREACGVILGSPEAPEGWRMERFENLQDRLHALDPERYPRDARTAYAMDPLKLQRRVDAAEAAGEALIAVFHSHPQHPAYFSTTDRAAASPFGLPSFPEAAQIVVSVFDGVVHDLKAFGWDAEREDWPELPVSGLPDLPGPPPGAAVYGEV